MPDAVDLHIHTSYSSDGDHCPTDILEMAAGLQLRAISVADHDTVAGACVAVAESERYGIEVLPNVEITTFFDDIELHMLSYYIDMSDDRLLQQLDQLRESDELRVKATITRLNEIGVDVSYDEVKLLSPTAPPKLSLIVKAAMQNGRNAALPLFQDYISGQRATQPYHNFFLDHMRPGGAAHVAPLSRYATTDAITLILACGGIPILAHPCGSLSLADIVPVLDALRDVGLCGVEVYSSYHSEDDESALANYSAQHKLIVTAGSDFHGVTIKPEIRMGELRYHPYAMVEQLRERRAGHVP